ncbi:hypothetical protein PTKIN_Ptkin10aG0017300 [Pterospermum kingtungense]
MEETIARIIADLEETSQIPNTQTQSPLISRSTLIDLQSLLSTNDPDLISQFFDDLASRNLSPSSLTNLLSLTMDSAPSFHLSLLASKAYLSLLLFPNSPVFTLFTPISFLSLLRSLRRAFKNRPLVQAEESDASQAPPNRKKKGGKRGRGTQGSVRSSGGCSEEEGDFLDIKEVFLVFEMLVSVLGLIHLDRFPDSLKSLIQTIGEIPLMAMEKFGNSGGFDRLMGLCSRVLGEVLRSEHGEMASTAAEVLKALSPLILTVKSQARSFALGFVTKNMMDLGNESDGVKKAVVNFPRYLVQKAPEKAEPRALAVDSIMEVVKVMDFEDQLGYIEYVLKMTQGKANLRLLGVDLIAMMLMSLRDPLGVESNVEIARDCWGTRCLEALILRCSDVSAGIRARALSSLAQVVGVLSGDDRNKGILKQIMGLGESGVERPEGGVNDLLRKRCMDEKAAVRKAALLLVTKLTALIGGSLDGVVLKTMGMACSDPLVSIRKAAISALSEAFRTFSDESVTTEWLHSIPRLITDNESSIQEECENLFLELVLDRVSRAGSTCSPKKGSVLSDSNLTAKSLESEMELLFPEGVLVLLRGICNGEVTPWVKKICTSLGKKKRLKPRIATALQNIIKTSESLWLSHSMPIEKWTAPAGAWFLLSEVSAYLSKAVDWEFLHHHWQLLDKNGAENKFQSSVLEESADSNEEGIESYSVAWAGDRVFLLQTISNVSVELPAEPAADLAHNLLKRVEKFNMHCTEVNAHVKALRTLCKRKASSLVEADQLVMKWLQRLLSKACEILEKYISNNKEVTKSDSFFTPPRSGSRKGKQAATASRLLSKAVTAVYTVGSLVVVCPSADVSSIVPLLYTVITSGNPDPKNKLPGPKVSLKQTAPSLYIQAWLTMGKICLADGNLAKSYIPLFVQELEKSDCAALRNNLVVMMADFCVRYTALVDCYIAKITNCLRDPCELVRRQTFILLSRLLQRDYVKWRGVLFLRFLLCLVDESEKIRQLADFLFGNILKAKAPLLAYNSFVEAIYVLNDCHAHNGHNDSKNSRTESRLFSIRGNDERSRSKRMRIYVCLLKQMAPEHLLATFAKLCAEILAAASDGMLNIDDITGQSVLQDAFQILACKEIRASSNRGSATDTADVEEEGGDSSASAAAAKGRAITQAVRKGLIQNTIPIFIELKRLLESKNSPVTGSLMECLRVLLKDYKTEIDDMLVADKQLQKELIYDMQKYESAKARTAAANMQNPADYQSPHVSKAASVMNHAKNKLNQTLGSDLKIASAMADAAAEATARSVLKEVNKGAMTPPLNSISMPKIKSKSNQAGTNARTDRPLDVLESLRRRQSFNSDDEN